MNLFWLDLHPRKSARYACDQHVVKMITEHAQMICTVLQELGFGKQPMKSLGLGKDLLQWVYADFANFAYLHDLTFAYFLEYRKRYEKTHKGWSAIKRAIKACGGMEAARLRFAELGRDVHAQVLYVNKKDNEELWSCITVPPLYMPDEHKYPLVGSRQEQLRLVVRSYRRFYQKEKVKFARYFHSTPPKFMQGLCLTKS